MKLWPPPRDLSPDASMSERIEEYTEWLYPAPYADDTAPRPRIVRASHGGFVPWQFTARCDDGRWVYARSRAGWLTVSLLEDVALTSRRYLLYSGALDALGAEEFDTSDVLLPLMSRFVDSDVPVEDLPELTYEESLAFRNGTWDSERAAARAAAALEFLHSIDDDAILAEDRTLDPDPSEEPTNHPR